MNKTIKILAALLPLFITSCTNDDANVTTTPQQDPVVTLSAGITRGEGETGTTNTEPDPFSYNKIKVINVTRQGKGLPYSQAVFTKNTSGTTATWTSDSPLLWCGGMENTFHAVYPATADFSSFTVPSDQSDATKLASADWMTGEKTIEWSENVDTNEPISFEMKRHNAMVVISNITVTNNTGTVQDVKFNAKDNLVITPHNNGSAYEAILPSGGSVDDIFATISIYINTITEEHHLKIPESLSNGFEAGKKYTFAASYTYSGPMAPTRSAAPDNLTLVSVEPM